nr:uncharacterized protein LOC106690493 [Halyomorpha halys]
MREIGSRVSLEAMISATILVLCVGTALGFPDTMMAGSLEDSMVGSVNTSNNATQHGANLLSHLSHDYTAIARNFSNNLASFFSAALKYWSDISEELLNDCSRSVSSIPVIGTAVRMSNRVLKTETERMNTLGQKAIKTAKNVTNMNLHVWDRIVQTGLSAVKNISSKDTKIISDQIRNNVRAINEGFQISDTAYDEFPEEDNNVQLNIRID